MLDAVTSLQPSNKPTIRTCYCRVKRSVSILNATTAKIRSEYCIGFKNTTAEKYTNELEAKDVLLNINRMQAAERAKKCRFYPW